MSRIILYFAHYSLPIQSTPLVLPNPEAKVVTLMPLFPLNKLHEKKWALKQETHRNIGDTSQHTALPKVFFCVGVSVPNVQHEWKLTSRKEMTNSIYLDSIQMQHRLFPVTLISHLRRHSSELVINYAMFRPDNL